MHLHHPRLKHKTIVENLKPSRTVKKVVIGSLRNTGYKINKQRQELKHQTHGTKQHCSTADTESYTTKACNVALMKPADIFQNHLVKACHWEKVILYRFFKLPGLQLIVSCQNCFVDFHNGLRRHICRLWNDYTSLDRI